MTANPPVTWPLRHAWSAGADRAALAWCAEQLRPQGATLSDAVDGQCPAAIKMHGMQLVEAGQAAAPPLQDLQAVAHSCGWPQRLPGFVSRYMRRGPHWHGIPMGIHRGNCAWVNRRIAHRLGRAEPADARGLIAWLEEARRHLAHPLAVGGEPWQVGVLFEALVLDQCGADRYRQAFVQCRPEAWLSPAMRRALDALARLRCFVDDDALHLAWDEQLQRVRRGEAALQFMGDWARMACGPEVLEWGAAGTGARFIAILDFFAPLAGAHEAASGHAAGIWTTPAFQVRFARLKGCMPAVSDAWPAMADPRHALLRHGPSVLPSWTFDQCCAEGVKEQCLRVLHRHFIEAAGTAEASAQALAGICG